MLMVPVVKRYGFKTLYLHYCTIYKSDYISLTIIEPSVEVDARIRSVG